jgi:hypothetical protein
LMLPILLACRPQTSHVEKVKVANCKIFGAL